MKELPSIELKKENIVSAEDFIEMLNKSLDKMEDDFFKKYNRYPDLDNEEDYVLLADFLDISKQLPVFDNLKTPGTSPIHLLDINERGALIYHDLGRLLIKRFLKRKGFFIGSEQNNIFEAAFGNRDYNVPREEYASRINFAKDLAERKIPFPKNWNEFIEEIKKIKKVCFLNELYETNHDSHLKGFGKVGTHLVNPLGSAVLFLGNIRSWKDLIEKWKQVM